VRPLDTLEARPLPGTEGALRPFWSPDSRFVAFMAGGKLRKVPLSGGPAQTICDAPGGADGTWNADGVILFDGGSADPIWRVEASGGVAKIEVEGTTSFPGWPEFLPDGRHFLFMLGASSGDQALMVGELGSTDRKELFKTTSQVAYAPPGYLVYVREQTLVAQPFDSRKLEITGEPIPVGEGLGVNNLGGASFSLSATGVLVFRAGETLGRRIVWMDRNGKEEPALDDQKRYADTWLSPDGNRLAFDINEGRGKGDIWIRDLSRGITSRFTFDPEREFAPAWSPDGRRIAYSKMGKTWDLFAKDAAGTGEPVEILKSGENKIVMDWSKDGAWLIYNSQNKDTGWDLWALPMNGADPKPIPLVRTKFSEFGGSLSPDGKFLAFASGESGRPEIYVQEFPEARSKWQVSTNGGSNPSWRGDGRELYYRSRDLSIMAVPIKAGATFDSGTPQALFKARFALTNARALYRPTRDGQRFLVLQVLGRDAIPPATVVLNWTSVLK
ncbi:MAG: PD40 domain-containing protein, partial [Vicinamibacteria bacterium]|nr:PD40 domain-containing protein [Vicinamibacteria bacterium]